MKKKLIFLIVLVFIIISITFFVLKNQEKTFASSDKLTDVVKGLSSVSGSGVVKKTYSEYPDYSDYRYVGAEPNNYVMFNNDMYRIIGVFNTNTHGVTDKNGNNVELVKLIRTRILGSYNYSIYITDDYEYNGPSNYFIEGTSLWKLLNEYFYYDSNIDGNNCELLTFYNVANYSNNCSDLLGYAIKNNELKNYIQKTKWNLYPVNNNSHTSKDKFYLCERNLGTDCEYISRETFFTEAYIGLMYLSDYLYGNNLTGYDGDHKAVWNKTSNWLFHGSEWKTLDKTEEYCLIPFST